MPKGVEVQVLSCAQMKVIDREYVESHLDELLNAINSGAIFIYPTDTIYGLGTNALNENSVLRIREIKQRDDRPISILAPAKSWITENCLVSLEKLNEYLPGPYTLFAKRKNIDCVAPSINSKDDSLGVRIPKHWFTEVVSKAGVPLVTTSVNISGERHMEKLEDLDPAILDQVDYVVYEGERRGEGSTKINLL